MYFCIAVEVQFFNKSSSFSAQPQHTGNYTCSPSSSTPASIQLFVLDDKTGALTDSADWNKFNRLLLFLPLFLNIQNLKC